MHFQQEQITYQEGCSGVHQSAFAAKIIVMYNTVIPPQAGYIHLSKFIKYSLLLLLLLKGPAIKKFVVVIIEAHEVPLKFLIL